MIFAVANTKGGVGKTTTAIHLATMLARNFNTLLIDGDPQASAASWAAWRRDSTFSPSPTTTRLDGKAVLAEGKALAGGFAHTVWTPAGGIQRRSGVPWCYPSARLFPWGQAISTQRP